MLRRLSSSIALVTVLAGAACGHDEGGGAPVRSCVTNLWAKPERPGATIEVVGSWDDWSKPLSMFDGVGEGYYVLPLALPPGEYGYRIVEDGIGRLDRYNPLTTFRGEREVSLLIAQDCASPELRVDAVESSAGAVTVRGTFLRAEGGAPLAPAGVRATIGAGEPIAAAQARAEDGSFTFSIEGLPRGKHTLMIEAEDAEGRAAAPARAVAWVEPAMESWADGVLYHVLIDRYRGDGGAPLAPPATPGSRAGGTLDGVRSALEDGTFDKLGVTALWLSPVYTNPVEARQGLDGNLYEGYHGYWPLEPRGVDERLGGGLALQALIESAHQRGIRVLLDLVPNHVYEASPRYLAHQGDGWFHDGADKCTCGTTGCDWGTHIQTCWFTPYLPDVRWQNADATNTGVDDARWWVDSFDADGIRIDAVPMMPRAATRRIAAALRGDASPRDSRWVLGEVFTGPGQGGVDAIRYFMGPHGLDSAFDFPLMWAIRDALANDRGGFDAVEAALATNESALRGSGAILARMLDNHDTSRFISEASGDAGANAWTNPAKQPADPEPYRRLAAALGLIFTLPGIPLIYQGDELGLAGGGDPDCRRVMPAESALSAEQSELLATARRLGALRRCSTALRRGDRVLLAVTKDTYAFLRAAGDDQPVIALFSRAAAPTTIAIPAAAGGTSVPPGEYVDILGGEPVTLAEGGSVPIEPMSFKILVPASSPCR